MDAINKLKRAAAYEIMIVEAVDAAEREITSLKDRLERRDSWLRECNAFYLAVQRLAEDAGLNLHDAALMWPSKTPGERVVEYLKIVLEKKK